MNRYCEIIKSLLGLLLILIFILNCKPQKPSDKEQKHFTQTFWKTSTPEEQGLKSSFLTDMLTEIKNNELRIRSIIIIRNRHLVLESYVHPYDSGISHDVKSVSKSIISSLAGIALRENIIKSLDQNVYDFFPEYSSIPKKKIRLRHLLMMASGLELDENGPIMEKILSQNNLIEATLSQPAIEKAGEQFNYCTFNTHVMSGILTRASGIGLLELSNKYLFEPLGIKNVYWLKDEQGYYFGGDKLWLTPRDMAKFGYLFLNKGKWEDKQIIPVEWVIESTKNKFHNFNDSGYSGYGYGWWLNEKESYCARGFGGQIISVYPQWNMVVVFTGADNYQWQTLSNKYIIPSISDKYRLPPDVTTQELLKKLIQELKNPEPQLPHPLPEIAKKISGKKYILKKNDLNFTSLTLWFEKDTECRLLINYNQDVLDMAIGLDNIYRVSQDISWGMKPDKNILALRGEWSAEKRFYIDFQEVGEPFYFDIELTFDEDEIRLLFIWQPFNMKFPLEGKVE
jgi:CubicO group peptidase (beta-lactamase class C family)